MTTERWTSVEDVARHLGVAKDSVYRWLEPRSLPAHKIGRLWKFQLDAALAGLRDECARLIGAGKKVVLS
ncbi:excisionase family DNA-binding protein [Sorangium sp. So ce124]|uniref:excisionase family DNA-binding protein n=1 Tax=Sorangium sp. So ce124 TaxID=3133280 RepID=UPI003F5FB24B